MTVSNFDEVLPKCKEVYIKIDEKTKKISEKEIKGIKIKPFEHQLVLAKQIIEHIENGTQKLHNGEIRNINQWIKSDIGTGKSLILLMILQYFKNKDYKTIPLTVPYKSDILTCVKKNDNIPFKANEFGGGYYQYIYNQDYVLHEILKTSGFHYADSKYIKEIQFDSVKKQSILFVQNQVMKQFQKYIESQTSLTYYNIDSNTDFIKYMLNYESINEDIILWNTTKVNVQQALIDIQHQLKLIYLNQTPQEIINKMEDIRQFYTIDREYSFNKFWIEHMNKRQKQPFAFVCFDDFDTMTLENFQWIPSLVNMYIGTTMIQKTQQSINQCSSFIFNKLINKYSAFRVVPEQIKEILKFPKVNIENILCKTQSNIYAQFKLLQYIFNVYQQVKLLQKEKETKKYIIPSDKDYVELVSGKTNIDNLFTKYILQFNINEFNIIPAYIDITFQLQLVFKINMCDEKILKAKTQKDKQFYQQKVKQYQEQLFNQYDNTFIKYLITEQKKDPQFLGQLQKKVLPFEFNDSELKQSQIYDVIDNKPIQSSETCLTSCCCMMFNKNNIKKAVNISGLSYYCSFCKQQIPDIKRFVWYNQGYFQGEEFEFSPVFTEQKTKLGQTKIEQIMRLIKENTQYDKNDSKEHSYYDINDQKIIKKNKITILYSEDILDLPQMKETTKEYEFETVGELVQKINENKQIYIYPYQYDQNYDQFRKDQEFELQCLFRELSQKHQSKFQILMDAYKILKTQIKQIPDVIQIKSVQQITGENMVYADNFIFASIPHDYNEFLQIVGRSNRIQREEENDVFMLYYPHQEILTPDQ